MGVVVRISLVPLLAAAVLGVAPVQAQTQPVALEGDGHEILGVALALGDKCERYRGFEYQFVSKMFRKAYHGSAAEAEVNASSRAAGAEARKEQMRATSKRFADKYRQKADRIGCQAGVSYLDAAMAEAYKEMAAIVVYANARAENSSGGLAGASYQLTDVQRQIIGLFVQTAQQMFGSQFDQFNALIPDLVRAKEQEYARGGLSEFVAERDHTLTMLHHEALIATSGWQVKGFSAPSAPEDQGGSAIDSAYGYHTARLSKSGEPSLTLIADPVFASVGDSLFDGNLADENAPQGYVSVGMRDDGTLIAGLIGGNFATAPQTLRIKAGWKGGLVEHFLGRPVTQGCPFVRCYAFTPDEARKLVNVDSYFALVESEHDTNLGADSQSPKVPRQRMKALVEAIK